MFCSVSIATYHKNETPHVSFTSRISNDTCKQNFYTKLCETDWHEITYHNDVNEVTNLFIDKLFEIYDNCFPLIEFKRKKKDIDKPYITPQIKELIQKKRRLQRKFFKHPSKFGKEFRALRNYVNKVIKNAKEKYNQSRIERDKANPQASTSSTANRM